MPSHLNSFRSSGDLNTRRNALPASSHLAKKRTARASCPVDALLALSEWGLRYERRRGAE